MARILLFVSFTIGNDRFEELLTAKDPNSRVQAIESLRPLGGVPMARKILPLLGDPHARVRLRAARALSGLRDPGAVNLVMTRGLRHPDARVRKGTCDVLGALAEPRFVDPLLARLKDRHPEVRGAAANALGRLNHPPAVPYLLDAFQRDRSVPLRVAVVDVLGRDHPELLESAASDRHYQVRLAAAELSPTEALMHDRDWRVRNTTIESCRRERRPEFIDWLIDRLPREEGRMKWDVWTALRDMAGRDLGPDAAPWRAWWEVNRDRFVVPPPSGTDGAPVSTQSSFFGVPIVSTRILFVLDLSGSMRAPSPDGKRSKLDVAKDGLLAAIGSLPPRTRFGITGLGCAADGTPVDPAGKTWQRLRLLPAVPRARADAARFVRRLESKGWTDLYDGLARAFLNPDLDTVYLYTDGGASKGTFVASREILDAVRRMNRFRRIVVHTIEVPGNRSVPAHQRLLAGLAEATGGTCSLSKGR